MSKATEVHHSDEVPTSKFTASQISQLRDHVRDAARGFSLPWYTSSRWEGFDHQAATRPLSFETNYTDKQLEASCKARATFAAVAWANQTGGWASDANDLIHFGRELDELNFVARQCGVHDIMKIWFRTDGDLLQVSMSERLHPPVHEMWRETRIIQTIDMSAKEYANLANPDDWTIGTNDFLFGTGAALVDVCQIWAIALDRYFSESGGLEQQSVQDIKIGTLAPPPLSKHAPAILQALASSLTVLNREEIAQAVEKSSKTLRSTVDMLEQRGLIKPIYGERSGYSCTDAGHEWLSSQKK